MPEAAVSTGRRNCRHVRPADIVASDRAGW